jgi:pilus assembly protein CpaB
MNRRRMLLLALVSLAVSVVVTVIGYRLVERRLNPAGRMGRVVVAGEKLGLGTRITTAQLRTVPWPKGVALEGAFGDVEELVGRGVVVPIVANEPVLESKLAPREAGAGLTTAIPAGMRAVAVKVNDVIGVAGFVLPGTRVDVILTGSPDDGHETDTARVILENVQVLTAGRNVEPDATGTPQNVPVVTLLVTPDDAQRLSLASADGHIQLALRNPLDLDHEQPVAVKKMALYTGAAPLPPVKPGAAPVKAKPTAVPAAPDLVVELILGQKREKWTFEQN